MASYIALLRKEPGSDFSVNFPDFPGCITAGKTLEEARVMAAEALGFHIEGMVEDGTAVPAPSDLDAVMSDPDNADAVAFMVDAPVEAARAVRVNITIPEDLLREIDRATKNRSKFLASAARAALNRAA
jgi:predicted RNase H-like HicB family nuclease